MPRPGSASAVTLTALRSRMTPTDTMRAIQHVSPLDLDSVKGLHVSKAPRSLKDLDNDLIASAKLRDRLRRRAPRIRTRPPPSTIEFLCDGCGEIHCRPYRGGPAPRFCGATCKARVWRFENNERSNAATRRWYAKTKGQQ